jgi:hypothetical protein
MTGFKLLHRRKDGSLGSLFISRGQRIPLGKWLRAKFHPTKGYAPRKGWHGTLAPSAPHLRTTGDRVWAKVEFRGVQFFDRPVSQGGTWILANEMKVVALEQ